MWVRIQELLFAPDLADALIRRLRDTTISRYPGEGYRGSRLLLDRPNGRALDVSYWDGPTGVPSDLAMRSSLALQALGVTPGPTSCYELAIDAC
jgi:hypothetical protein